MKGSNKSFCYNKDKNKKIERTNFTDKTLTTSPLATNFKYNLIRHRTKLHKAVNAPIPLPECVKHRNCIH